MDIEERSNGEKLIRVREAARLAGISRSTVYVLESEGKFPKRRKIPGLRSVGWLRSEVEAWVRELPEADG